MRYVAGAFIVVAAAFVITGIGAVVMLTAQTGQGAPSVEIKDASGAKVGGATLTQTPNGVLVKVNLTKVPPGGHAFHIHETGRCEAPFESAGGHFNPANKKHGFLDAAGPHAGDLPNIDVPQSGALTFEFLARDARLTGDSNNLLDADGAALVMHAGLDDYRTDPAGKAGDRIACGVVTQ